MMLLHEFPIKLEMKVILRLHRPSHRRLSTLTNEAFSFENLKRKKVLNKLKAENPADIPKTLNFTIESYGCQMNVADSEIVRSLLVNDGHNPITTLEESDLILINTCAIRDNAEAKIWHRLAYFQSIRNKNRLSGAKAPGLPLVGVLGCMAERLKTKLLEEDVVDFVCGPDAYRDINKLVHITSTTDQKAANVQLSLEETYADITPIRETSSSTSAFVSIMRGCNNMCSYCIVPFTRGRERSRSIHSIVNEVKTLSQNGIKEIVLLGQNVNSYHDISEESKLAYPESAYESVSGFSNMYKNRDGPGARFADLLQAVSEVAPETRIRFTSPHPKDFPIRVLELIASTPNLCPSLHLPAQSGSTTVLERMRRGYSRAAYDSLVSQARALIPHVCISSDFISGFCGETESEHRDTIDLLRNTQFDQAYMFAYSLRDKTHAARTMADDVPEDVKQRRLQEVIDTFYEQVQIRNDLTEVGKLRLVLVEGESWKKGTVRMWSGRTDENKRCLFPAEISLPSTYSDYLRVNRSTDPSQVECSLAGPGDYVLVRINEARCHTLRATPLAKSSISEYWKMVKNFT